MNPMPFDPKSLPQWLWCFVAMPMAGGAYWLLTFGQRTTKLVMVEMRKQLNDSADLVKKREEKIEQLERELELERRNAKSLEDQLRMVQARFMRPDEIDHHPS